MLRHPTAHRHQRTHHAEQQEHQLVQQHRHHRQMPRVLGIVFRAAAPGVERLAEDFLQLITLGDELDLAREAFGGGFVHEGATKTETPHA